MTVPKYGLGKPWAWLLAAAVGLAGCASGPQEGDAADPAGDPTNTAVAQGSGECPVTVPTQQVDFGMAPFGDHLILSAAMAQDWFEEVGIDIGPEKYSTIPYEQIVPLLINADYDITSEFGPHHLQSRAQAPSVEYLAFSDTYLGLYVLAPPGTDHASVSELVESGTDFDEAMETVMAQVEGKTLAIDDTGSHRAFVDALFAIAGTTTDAVGEIRTMDDSQMLLQARGGQIDFAKPLGGAQTAELIMDGWYPIVGVDDVVRGLPAGDPRGVSGIGHTGLVTTEGFYGENPDTVLRVAGVMYRVIDQIIGDIENETDDALQHILPVLESAASIEMEPEGLRIIYGTIDPMVSFEDQAEYWLEEDNPFYYKNVYGPQIEAAQEGGVLPEEVSIDDTFNIAHEVYTKLRDLEAEYSQLNSEVDTSSLTGASADCAEAAERHYEARNYVDAVRFMSAAVEDA